MSLTKRPKFQRNGEVDQHLEDLLVGGNLKQALALCDKRLKKAGYYEEDTVGCARCGTVPKSNRCLLAGRKMSRSSVTFRSSKAESGT